MKYLTQFLLILAITFVGELLHALIPLPIPAGIYGLLLLFAGLVSGLIPLRAVKETGKFLIEIMPVMFVPAAVGLLDAGALLRENPVAYVVILVVTTVVVMGVSGRVTQAVMRRGGKGAKE